MDLNAPIHLPSLHLLHLMTDAPLDGAFQYNGQIGYQNAPQMILETAGRS